MAANREKETQNEYQPYAPNARSLAEQRDGGPAPSGEPGQCCGLNPQNARSGQIDVDEQAQMPQVAGGGGAPTTGAADQELSKSEVAENQQANASRSRADSGVP